ncbi:uncharacterized protein LOC106170949 [Lingula anatina]|uniref:Uncharacterized protein LOC106170949 n=1 Tax=Lingula anatina TaxID=7574 RepID=A0A2R2MP75_LINAN|nr:uncharacterized protein LOC106170949 [Lingula anatina]|eukprot:XP_023932036.1 uncharacterized protein LOC106170949 [Lingula anatina]
MDEERTHQKKQGLIVAEIDKFTRQGTQELSQGNSKKALAAFSNAFKRSLPLNDGFTERACAFNLGAVYIAVNEPKKGLELLQRAVPPLNGRDGPSNGDLYYNFGLGYEALSDLPEAIRHYSLAQEEYRNELTNFQMESDVCLRLADLYTKLNKFSQAADSYRNAATVYLRLGDLPTQAKMMCKQAGLLIKVGDTDKAIEVTDDCLKMCKNIEESPDIAKVMVDLGILYTQCREFSKAASCFEEGLPHCRGLSADEKTEAVLLQNLGAAYNSLGDFQRALSFHQKAADLHGKFRNRTSQGESFMNLAFACTQTGDDESAEEYYKHAQQAAKDGGDSHGEWQALEGLGVLAFVNGSIEKAVRYFKQALGKLSVCESNPQAQERIVAKLTDALSYQLQVGGHVDGSSAHGLMNGGGNGYTHSRRSSSRSGHDMAGHQSPHQHSEINGWTKQSSSEPTVEVHQTRESPKHGKTNRKERKSKVTRRATWRENMMMHSGRVGMLGLGIEPHEPVDEKKRHSDTELISRRTGSRPSSRNASRPFTAAYDHHQTSPDSMNRRMRRSRDLNGDFQNQSLNSTRHGNRPIRHDTYYHTDDDDWKQRLKDMNLSESSHSSSSDEESVVAPTGRRPLSASTPKKSLQVAPQPSHSKMAYKQEKGHPKQRQVTDSSITSVTETETSTESEKPKRRRHRKKSSSSQESESESESTTESDHKKKRKRHRKRRDVSSSSESESESKTETETESEYDKGKGKSRRRRKKETSSPSASSESDSESSSDGSSSSSGSGSSSGSSGSGSASSDSESDSDEETSKTEENSDSEDEDKKSVKEAMKKHLKDSSSDKEDGFKEKSDKKKMDETIPKRVSESESGSDTETETGKEKADSDSGSGSETATEEKKDEKESLQPPPVPPPLNGTYETPAQSSEYAKVDKTKKQTDTESESEDSEDENETEKDDPGTTEKLDKTYESLHPRDSGDDEQPSTSASPPPLPRGERERLLHEYHQKMKDREAEKKKNDSGSEPDLPSKSQKSKMCVVM